MASPLFTGLALLLTILCSISPCASSRRPKSSNPSFSVTIAHRDSSLSPLYDPNATEFDRVRAAYRRTTSRPKRLAQKAGRVSPETIEGYAFPDRSEFVMQYYIGTPEEQVFGIIDTASSLIWLQCEPCDNCFSQQLPIHNPAHSSTHVKMSCHDEMCPSGGLCGLNDTCTYYEEYIDNTYTKGEIATETFLFVDDSARDRRARFHDIIFGCGHNNTDEPTNKTMGVIGFNREDLSLLSQLEITKFSHCFVPYTLTDKSSRLHFGDEAILTGAATPILDVPSVPYVFYVTLEGITVGNEKLNIPPEVFNVTESGERGFYVDTGMTYTLLLTPAHNQLVDSVSAQSERLNRTTDPNLQFSMCYLVDNASVLFDNTPDITFHFAGGLDMKWKKASSYVEIAENSWCLAVARDEEYSGMGNFQMMNFNVGWDLDQNLLYIDGQSDCEGT